METLEESKITTFTNFEFFSFLFWRNFASRKRPVTLEGLSSLFHFVAKIPADFNYLIFFEVTNDLEKGKPPKKKINPKKFY
jgi:hypothetical protein